MLEKEFTGNEIVDFTYSEIIKTGAELKDVKFELILRFQRFRNLIRRRVCFSIDGLTSGDHQSGQWAYHKKGLAGDIFLREEDGVIRTLEVFKAALEAGFTGIGVYWDGRTYSFHFDLRSNFAFWMGVKKSGSKEWIYKPLLNDPMKIIF